MNWSSMNHHVYWNLIIRYQIKAFKVFKKASKQAIICVQCGLSSGDNAQLHAITVKKSSGQLAGCGNRNPDFRYLSISKGSTLEYGVWASDINSHSKTP